MDDLMGRKAAPFSVPVCYKLEAFVPRYFHIGSTFSVLYSNSHPPMLNRFSSQTAQSPLQTAAERSGIAQGEADASNS